VAAELNSRPRKTLGWDTPATVQPVNPDRDVPPAAGLR
jgi:hypothetical protein